MGTYRASFEGVGRMLRSEAMRAAMVQLAEKVKTRAEATAPFDPTSADGDHFKTSFSVSSTTHGGVKGDRAEATVSSSDPAGFYIEVGTSDTPAHRTLTRSLDAIGE